MAYKFGRNSGLGGFGSDTTSTDPFADGGAIIGGDSFDIDYDSLALQIAGCFAGLLTGGRVDEGTVRCVIDKVLGAVERTGMGIELLTFVTVSSSSDFLVAIGMSSEGAGILSAVIDPYWKSFQVWAGDEVYKIQKEEWLSTHRVEKVPLASGGGWIVTASDGSRYKLCSVPCTVNPEACPDGMITTQASLETVCSDLWPEEAVPRTFALAIPRREMSRSGLPAAEVYRVGQDKTTSKSDEQSVPWYKNKWTYIIGIPLLGGIGYAAYRYTR